MRAALGRILAITMNTYKEAARNRAFIGLMLGACALILSSLVISELVVFDQRKRVVQDFGLFFISLAGVIISIIVGVLLVFKELERKTIYPLLSKPVHRHEFILGRYFGQLLLLVTVTAVLSLGWVLVMMAREVTLRLEFFQAIVLIMGELSVVSAVAILFSSFSTPILSGIFTFGIFVLGREVYFIDELLSSSKGLFVSLPQVRPFGEAVTRIFPDLSVFDVSKEILLELDVSWQYVGLSMGYALAYVVLLITAAALIFERRDFV
jgi:ABC-type transport system involved in multi-copper enzyme maturation permease subunit